MVWVLSIAVTWLQLQPQFLRAWRLDCCEKGSGPVQCCIGGCTRILCFPIPFAQMQACTVPNFGSETKLSAVN